VANLDRRVAELFQLLRKHDLVRSSTILLVSDHGQCLGEHGFFGHGHELYDELVRIPGWIWDPDLPGDLKGRPATTDWIDHRHLHDLLQGASAHDSGPLPLEELLRESVANRGPAASYWEGRYSRHTPFSDDRQPLTRAVRVFRGGVDLAARWVSADPGRDRPARLDLPSDGPSDLLDPVQRILTQPLAATLAPGGAALTPDVDERLKGWGYL
jgi:hypothetical protein